MTAAYLFCLVLGGGLALISAFGDILGGGAHADFDIHADVDLDVHADVALHADTGAPGADAHVGYAASIFSLRSLIFSLFGFGATGSLLTFLGAGPGSPLTVGLSIGSGLLVGAVVGAFLGYLKRSETGAKIGETSFVGLTGRVTLPLADGAPGRIAVLRGEREHAVRALPYPREQASDPAEWKQVLVLEMRDGVAYVDPLDEDGVDLLGPGT